MPKHGKKFNNAVKDLDRTALYSLRDGIKNVLKAKFSKFDETFDIAMKLGVDPRHADQMIRSSVVLPNGNGKVTRVLVFAKGAKEIEAKEAGADFVGADELVEKIQGGWLDFDKTVATPDMMGTVGKIGRILGPRNLMPNAKLGTVTFDVANIVKEIKSGKVDFRVDKAGIIHAGVGKVSFGEEKIYENLIAFIEKIFQLKPSTSKGIYLRSIALSSTMGPGFKIDPLDVRNQIK
jgi:large subunit ribosomal protein L1